MPNWIANPRRLWSMRRSRIASSSAAAWKYSASCASDTVAGNRPVSACLGVGEKLDRHLGLHDLRTPLLPRSATPVQCLAIALSICNSPVSLSGRRERMRSRPASQARSLTRFFVPLILTGQATSQTVGSGLQRDRRSVARGVNVIWKRQQQRRERQRGPERDYGPSR